MNMSRKIITFPWMSDWTGVGVNVVALAPNATLNVSASLPYMPQGSKNQAACLYYTALIPPNSMVASKTSAP